MYFVTVLCVFRSGCSLRFLEALQVSISSANKLCKEVTNSFVVTSRQKAAAELEYDAFLMQNCRKKAMPDVNSVPCSGC